MGTVSKSIDWVNGHVCVIDQRVLPHEVRVVELAGVDEIIDAIRTLTVRGAPALGVAGALGVAFSAALHSRGGVTDEQAVRADAERLASARPTAVNLRWGVDRALGRLAAGPEAVLALAQWMLAEDERTNRAAASRAADLVVRLCSRRPLRVLTHCNTGRLATAAWGTALGAVRELHGRGVLGEVLADETRPLLQGSRLTAWELKEAGIAHRVCVDSAAAFALANGMADCVLVGADRICANGDTANKIGTYGLSLAAQRHGVPFIVVAPESSVDESLADGTRIVIEQRAGSEVTEMAGVSVAPMGTAVYNPAFDVTPFELITAVVTEGRVLLGGGSRADWKPEVRGSERLEEHGIMER
jgi:S-methyl-5-thioribose-1-phosphate isomerase